MQKLLGVLALAVGILAVTEGRSIPRCADGSRPVVSNTRVCSCPPAESIRERSKGSLIFVIDNTGSMGTVIRDVKNYINSILSANKLFKNYVIATFGDPYQRNVLKTTNRYEVIYFINRIQAVGGGDCPEFALSGVRDAAAVADPDSVLFLFTDASAKDDYIKHAVGSQLAAKNIRFIAVTSGRLCNTPGNEYKSIARRTGGQVSEIAAGQTSLMMLFIKRAVAGTLSFRAVPNNSAELRNVLEDRCECHIVRRSTCPKLRLPRPPILRRG